MSEWREQHAAVLEFEVAEWVKLLAELDNGEALAVARGNDKLAAELRATMSAIRSEVALMTTEANELRRRDNPDQMPISLTTRHRRPHRNQRSASPENMPAERWFECDSDDIDESGGLA